MAPISAPIATPSATPTPSPTPEPSSPRSAAWGPMFGAPPDGALSARSFLAAGDRDRMRAGVNASAPAVKLDVPWVNQFDESKLGEKAGKEGCLDSAEYMLKTHNRENGVPGKLDGRKSVHEVPKGPDGQGVDRERATEARKYIDEQLDKGRPVLVGVDVPGFNDRDWDGRSNHYVVITGRGVDEQGRTYYDFNDGGAGSKTNGGVDRFYVGDDGALRSPGNPNADYVKDMPYEVARVRKYQD